MKSFSVALLMMIAGTMYGQADSTLRQGDTPYQGMNRINARIWTLQDSLRRAHDSLVIYRARIETARDSIQKLITRQLAFEATIVDAVGDTAGILRELDQWDGAKNTTDPIERYSDIRLTKLGGEDQPAFKVFGETEEDSASYSQQDGRGTVNNAKIITESQYGLNAAGVDPGVIASRDWVAPAEVELDSNINSLDWMDSDSFFLSMTNSDKFVFDNVGARKSILLRVNTNHETVTLPDYVEVIRDDRTPPVDDRAPAYLYEITYINGRTYAEVASVEPDSGYVPPPDPVIDSIGPIWTPDDLTFAGRSTVSLGIQFTFPSSYPAGDAVASLTALVATLPISTTPDYVDSPPGEERFSAIVDTFSVVIASGSLTGTATLNRSMDSNSVWIEFEVVPTDTTTTAAQSAFSFRWAAANGITFDRFATGKEVIIRGRYICDSTYQSTRRLYVNRSTSVKEQGYAISPGVAALVNSFARLHSQTTITSVNTSTQGAIKFQSTDVAVIATYTFPASAVPATIQIVENPNMSVQHLTVPMSFLAQTTIATTAHDIAATLYLLTARTASSSPRYHNVFVVPPTDNLLLTIKRGGTFASGDSVTAYLMVVSFTDGSSNQIQTLSFGTSDLTLSPALLATVNRKRTLTFSTGGWAHSSGWVTSAASTAVLRGATTFNMSNNGAASTATRTRSGVTATTYVQNFTFNATTSGGSAPDSVSVGGAVSYAIPLIGTVLPNGQRQFTITGLEIGTRHYARLQAIDLAGNITYSRQDSDTTNSAAVVIDPNGSISRVWAVSDGTRIKRTSVGHSLAAGNLVWNNTTKAISLRGSKNETVAFQLMLEADNRGAENVNVIFDQLTKGGDVISNAAWNRDPFNYVGRHIEMFVMHYMNIGVRTNESFLWWSTARPGATGDSIWTNTDFIGWHGEQLVPFESPAGARTNGQGGAPFSIVANQLQSVWVDVYIPRTQAAGTYTGTIYVTQDGGMQYSVPVSLVVNGWGLSDTTSIQQTGYLNEETIRDHHKTGGAHPDSWTPAWFAMLRKYQQLAKRHRFNFQRGSSTIATLFSHEQSYIDGTLFTSDSGYAGPGEGQGPELFHIGVYDQPSKRSTRNDKGFKSSFGNREVHLSVVDADTATWRGYWQDAAQDIADSFAVYSPLTIVQRYGPEEASIEGGRNVADTSVFYDMRRKAGWLKGGGSDIPYSFSMNFRPQAKVMMTALSNGGTFYISPTQAGYMYSPTWLLNPYALGLVLDSVTSWRAASINLGLYGGTRPSFGTMMIDAPAIDQRVNAWICWKYDIHSFRHWYTGGGETTAGYNSWSKDYRLTSASTGSWGDGTFFYAGETKALYAGDSRNLAGPIAGVRLKNWRRGAQDHLYLKKAEEVGVSESAINAIVNSIVGSAGDAYSQSQPNTGWKQRGDLFDLARHALADSIAGRLP